MVVIGDGSDYVFGGMDGLYAKDWTYDEFVKRYYYIDPKEVLKEPVDMSYVFKKYRNGDSINFVDFLDDNLASESYESYANAFATANISYIDPYANLIRGFPLDLNQTRSGNSKAIVRELFRRKYPTMEVPQKNPMPRPVDMYFKNWKGPSRPEFRKDIEITKYSGNQKWMLFCLERFMDVFGT